MPASDNPQILQSPQIIGDIAARVGLRHPIEALLCAPARYEDYRVVHDNLKDLFARGQTDENVLYRVRVKSSPENPAAASVRGYGRRGAPTPSVGYKDVNTLQLHYPFGRNTFRLDVDTEDRHGTPLLQSIFGGTWAWKDILPGEELVLRGKLKRFGGTWTVGSPEMVRPNQVGKINPVYLAPTTARANSDEMHALIEWVKESDERLVMALEAAADRVRQDCGDMSDEQILALCTRDNDLIQPQTLPDLLMSLHFPAESPQEGEAALAIVKRICALSMQCIAARVNTRAPTALAPIGRDQEVSQGAQTLIQALEAQKRERRPDFSLTENQKEVIAQIAARLGDETPLKGILNGEVGAGKTACYAIPAVAAHMAGARVGIIAPTDLLAQQIAEGIAEDFGPSVAVERVMAGRKIRNPDAILVGTIGLNGAAKKIGWKPNLMIFDEQHKIHTAARDELVEPYTHTLEVSATPIPRSLALSLYGGMDIFVLNEQPVKKDIQTGLLGANERSVATAAIRKALREGKRVAIVYTLVDRPEEAALADDVPAQSKKAQKEQDAKARSSAVEAAALFEQHFPGKVALLHGKMKPNEKTEALDRFRRGDAQLIVTTTVFETGIDVPDIQLIVIRDPEHLGLSALHQLRGRVARTGGLGLCLLLTEDLDALSDSTYERLDAFCSTLDGYELATKDLIARGAGELDGLQQNGKASTTFKAVKMDAIDLLNLDGQRPELEVTAQLVDGPSIGAAPMAAQQRLFA